MLRSRAMCAAVRWHLPIASASSLEASFNPRMCLLGTINPIAEMVRLAHAKGIPVLVDGAQAAPHLPIDVQALGCDFYTVSGHKMFGPTGIGLLYGRAERLEALPPYQGGGDMIRSVTFAKTTFAPIPAKFEAGTPHIAGIGANVVL